MHVILIRKSFLKKILLCLVILVLAICILIVFGKRTKKTWMRGRTLPIYSVNTDEKKIAITFDTSWGYDNTEKILDVLSDKNVKATFFVIGKWVDSYPSELKEIANRGNEIGNHSDSHKNYTTFSKNQIIQDIDKADAKIIKVAGIKPILFRFPSGSYDEKSTIIVKGTNHIPIQWDVDSIDWKNKGSDLEFNRVIKKAKNGSIILFHNSGKYTPETLERVIDYFSQRGYKFVKVSDLIYKDNYYLDENGTQNKN
ncbi:MAG: polysaccharide deacetylase family protein [Clostridium sp.]|nr:polysaccharide deacetylase family protein [Clostridium sp.]